MKKSTAIIVSTLGVLAVAGTITYFVVKNKNEENGGSTETRCKGEDCEDDEVTVPTQAKDLIGKEVSPDVKEGFTHVRRSPKIDGSCKCAFGLCLTCTGNTLGRADKEGFGEIIDAETGADGYIWYKVSLKEPLDDETKGWVREDAVRV